MVDYPSIHITPYKMTKQQTQRCLISLLVYDMMNDLYCEIKQHSHACHKHFCLCISLIVIYLFMSAHKWNIMLGFLIDCTDVHIQDLSKTGNLQVTTLLFFNTRVSAGV